MMIDLYDDNHPSGFRLWGFDDESICLQNDITDEEVFWLQDEPELYNKVLALCIKHYYDNKKRIDLDKLPC